MIRYDGNHNRPVANRERDACDDPATTETGSAARPSYIICPMVAPRQIDMVFEDDERLDCAGYNACVQDGMV